jgi:hypothetical protein
MTMSSASTKSKPKPKRHRSQKYAATPLIGAIDISSFGPAMQALNPRQQRFVLELQAGPVGYGSEVRAARAAGYFSPTSTKNSRQVITNSVLHNPKVQAALAEVGSKIIRAASFTSIKNTEKIANDLHHRDCLKANLALMDRGGFAVETMHHITVEHKIDYSKQALQELETFRRLGVARERLEDIFGRDGLFHLEQQLDKKLAPPLIETEYTAVES